MWKEIQLRNGIGLGTYWIEKTRIFWEWYLNKIHKVWPDTEKDLG